MNVRESQPEVGAVRILFRCADTLAPDKTRDLAGRLVAGLPVAPDEVEVNPSGDGFVLYVADDAITLDDLTAVVEWLRRYPPIVEVWWDTVIDV